MSWQKFYVWDAIVYGFKETCNNIRVVLCSMLIILTETLISLIVVGLPTITFALWQMPELRPLFMQAHFALWSDGYRTAESILKNNIVVSQVPLTVIIACLCALIILLTLQSMFTVGYIRMIIKFHDTGTAELKELFMGWHRGPRFLLATLLFTVGVTIGLGLFIVPGLYILVHGSFYSFFIVDKSTGIFESFKKSFNATRGYGWQIATLILINFLFKFSIITILIASFMKLLMNTYVYRRLTA